MASFNFHKVLTLPETLVGNQVYMLPGVEAGTFIMYASDSTGTTVKQLGVSTEVLGSIVITSDVAPDPTTTQAMFWWDSNGAALFVKYKNGENTTWVEAQPTAIIPQFENTGGLWGVKDTMARSDHSHDSLNIEAEW